MQKGWSFFFGGVLLAELVLLIVSPAMGWWLPENISTYGGSVDLLFYVILGFTGFFFVLTEAVLVYNMYAFAYREGHRSQYVEGNNRLELAWTIVPAAILLYIAFVQIETWAEIKYQSRTPEPDQVVTVTAHQWEWRMRYYGAKDDDQKTYQHRPIKFRYTDDVRSALKADGVPDDVLEKLDKLKGKDFSTRHEFVAELNKAEVGEYRNTILERAAKYDDGHARTWANDGEFDDYHGANELHTWKGANVKIFLKTRDVIHSFFLPNLRLKQDALPGKTIPMWFNATEANVEYVPGSGLCYLHSGGLVGRDEPTRNDKEFEITCAELCGGFHYRMRGHLYVHKSKESYEAWLADAHKKQRSRQPETREPVASAQ